MTTRNRKYSDLSRGLTITSEGEVKKVYDFDSVMQSVTTILSTIKGERLMLPEFGSDLKFILFEPMDHITEQLIESEIKDAINRWEDRITITRVDVTSLYDRNGYAISIKSRNNTTLENDVTEFFIKSNA